MRPELINRLDEIIVFNNLSKANILNIVKIQLEEVSKRLYEKQIIIKYDSNIITWLCEVGYNTIYGARPLKRCIQKYILDFIAKGIVSGDILPNKPYTLTVNNNTICMSK